MGFRARTLQAASVRLFVWSPTRAPHELAYGLNMRMTAQFAVLPQYQIGTNEPYELIDGVFSGQLSFSWLIVPVEKIYSLGFLDPADSDTAGERLLKKLGAYDGINFLGEDKLTGAPLFKVSGARMTTLGMTITRRAVLFRDAQFVVRSIPSLQSELFS